MDYTEQELDHFWRLQEHYAECITQLADQLKMLVRQCDSIYYYAYEVQDVLGLEDPYEENNSHISHIKHMLELAIREVEEIVVEERPLDGDGQTLTWIP